jgi:hypothetical protein
VFDQRAIVSHMEMTAEHTSSNGPAPGAVEAQRLYVSATEELSAVAGILNAAHGRLVDLAILTLAEGHHVGPGLHSPAQYLAWQTGVDKPTAHQVLRVAERADELPHLLAALRAGRISLDQAAVVARHCPTRYDRSATQLACVATVQQLRTVLRSYRFGGDDDGGAGKRPQARGVSISRDDDGATVRARLSNDAADVVERALDAMRDDLFRQREADAKAAAAEEGGDPRAFDPPSSADALVALTETALQAAEAAHPGADRYLVSYHLHQSPDGHLILTDDRGRPVDDAERRRILCDCAGEAVLHAADGTPLSVGRKTRTVGRKLRRAILFRHRHRCAVPGCDTTHGLDIHHIWHWEDGGPTDAGNLLPLCRHHHKAHHRGALHIAGNADLPAGAPGAVEFTTPERVRIPDLVPPRPVIGPVTARTLQRLRRELARRTAHRRPLPHRHRVERGPVASTPTGERMSRWGVHLNPDPPPEPPLRT